MHAAPSRQTTRWSLSIDDLLERAVTAGASDLHLTVGSAPAIRVHGEIETLGGLPCLDAATTGELVGQITTAVQQQRLEHERQLDFAYAIPGLGRFRVNAYHQRGTLAAAFRTIPDRIRTLEELCLPESLHELARKPHGLVLVTGPTGSGKTTTLAALIDEINRDRAGHIVTIEDPIEFIHPNRSCLVNQRQIGIDATGFADALRGALRQDPDVILLGEMRDLETIATALTAAETGHLVFGTLHTQNAPSTIDRVIDAFPASQQGQVRMQLAAALQGVVTQTLVPRADGSGRVPALEVLLLDDAIRNLVRQGKIEQVYSYMQTGSRRGLQTMEQSLAGLVQRGIITAEAAVSQSSRPEALVGMLERAGSTTAAFDHATGSGIRVAAR